MVKTMKRIWFNFFQRQFALFPFEIAFALFSVFTGVTALFKMGFANGVFSETVGRWAIAFNLLYTVAGVAMYVGLVFARRNIEAFGLIITATSLLVRFIVLFWCSCQDSMVHLQVISAQGLHFVFLLACIARTILIIQGHYMIVKSVGIGIHES